MAQKMERERLWQQLLNSSLQYTQEFDFTKLDHDTADVYDYMSF